MTDLTGLSDDELAALKTSTANKITRMNDKIALRQAEVIALPIKITEQQAKVSDLETLEAEVDEEIAGRE